MAEGWAYKTFTDVSFNLIEAEPGTNALVTAHEGQFLLYPFNLNLDPSMTGTPASAYRVYSSSQMTAAMVHMQNMAEITKNRDFAVQLFHNLDANGYVNLKDNDGNDRFRFGFHSSPTEYYFSITWYMEDGSPGTVFRRDTDTYPDYYEGSVLRIPVLGYKGKYIDFNNSNMIEVYDYITQVTTKLNNITRNKMTEIHEYQWLAPLEDSELYFTSRLTGVTYGTASNIKFTPDCIMYILKNFYKPGSPAVYVEDPAIYIASVTPILYTDAESGFTSYASQQFTVYYQGTLPANTFTVSAVDIKMTPGVPPTPGPGEEPEFMNELSTRYSPRSVSNILGIYVFDEDTMQDVAVGLMRFGLNDIAAQFFGGDGKDMVVGIRFYYGLNPYIARDTDYSPAPDIRCGNKFLFSDDSLIVDPSTVIPADKAKSEYCKWFTPVLNVPEYFEDYRDYLCSYQLYLPYYGFVDLDPNDVVGGSIRVYYNINIVTGAAVIQVVVNNSRTNNQDVKAYVFTTTVGVEIPFGANAAQSMMLGFAQVLGKAFTSAVGLGTGLQSSAISANINRAEEGLAKLEDTEYSPEMLVDKSRVKDRSEKELAELNRQANSNQAMHNIISSVPTPSVNAPKRTGGSGSETGSMDELYPYLLITRPVSATPADYTSYVGKSASTSIKLSSCTGFTQVSAIRPDTLSNAPKYLNEIISLLQAGVYL